MKTTHLLATVAAALLLNAGAASAQGMGNMSEGAAPAPAAQQKAPAEKSSPAMKQGASDHKGAAEHRAGNKPAETTGQATDKDKGGTTHKGAESKSSSESMKKGNEAQKTPDASKSGNQAQQSPSSTQGSSPKQNNAQGQTGTKSNQSSSSTTTQQSTTGQGAAASAANIPTEQRTKITSVIKQQNVQRVDKAKLNVDIRVGARLPESGIHFYPLPTQVVEIHPAWRGFEYILVGDEILVINPRTHEIVAILQA